MDMLFDYDYSNSMLCMLNIVWYNELADYSPQNSFISSQLLLEYLLRLSCRNIGLLKKKLNFCHIVFLKGNTNKCLVVLEIYIQYFKIE